MSDDDRSALIYELASPRRLAESKSDLGAGPLASDAVYARTLTTVISPGTEIGAYIGAAPLRSGSPYPRLVGYCNVAEVLEIGSGVSGVKIGDRIATFESHRSAFICPESDIAAVVGEHMDTAEAASTYLFHLGYQSLLSSDVRAGSNVAIIGLGTLGLTTVAAGNLFGCRTVAISGQSWLREKAESYGAHLVLDKSDDGLDVIPEWTGNDGVDVVILTSNAWSDWQIAQKIARKGGMIAVLGFPGREEGPPQFNPLDPEYFYVKQLTYKAVGPSIHRHHLPEDVRFNIYRNYRYLLDQIDAKRLPAADLISEVVPWTQLGAIYERLSLRETGLLTAALDWNAK